MGQAGVVTLVGITVDSDKERDDTPMHAIAEQSELNRADRWFRRRS